MRNWSTGYTARKKPARLDPMAGASREVNERAMRGLRRLNGFASCLRRLSRRRVKKRRRRRWNSKISDSEHVKRTFGDLYTGSGRGGLCTVSMAARCTTRCYSPFWLTPGQEPGLDEIPRLEAREGHHGEPQAGADRGSIVVVASLCNCVVLLGRQRALPDGRGSR